MNARTGESIVQPDSPPQNNPAPTDLHIYFLGAMKSEGALEISADDHFTLSQVPALKGGLGDFADRTKIKIVRYGLAKPTLPEIIDLTKITDQGHFEKDPGINPGDTIIVPRLPVSY